jgi:hypothetical protein
MRRRRRGSLQLNCLAQPIIYRDSRQIWPQQTSGIAG